MTVELDATDGLESGDPLAATTGVAGRLATLEMLLYPNTVTVVTNAALLARRHHRGPAAGGSADRARVGSRTGGAR